MLFTKLCRLWLIVLTTVAVSRAMAQDRVGLYLTWTDDPATTMNANWVDLYPEGPLTVFYRPAGVVNVEQWKSVEASEWRVAEGTLTVVRPSVL